MGFDCSTNKLLYSWITNSTKMMRQIRLICILGFALFSIQGFSCLDIQVENDIDPKALDILEGFVFVGSGPAKFLGDGSVDSIEIASHGESEMPRPRKLEKGVQYIFHHPGPIDDESLALRELPSRLSKMGFKILKAPPSTSGLMYLFIGGPLFYIEFSDESGKHKAVIFNQIDDQNTDGLEDYILVYLH